MYVRTYTESINDVFSHLGKDHQIIKNLAKLTDTLGCYANPDNHDYREELKTMPYIEARSGELFGDLSQHVAYFTALTSEMFSHEIRSKRTLAELAAVYKRLSAVPEVPRHVLHDIILKMLWLSSGRAATKQIA